MLRHQYRYTLDPSLQKSLAGYHISKVADTTQSAHDPTERKEWTVERDLHETSSPRTPDSFDSSSFAVSGIGLPSNEVCSSNRPGLGGSVVFTHDVVLNDRGESASGRRKVRCAPGDNEAKIGRDIIDHTSVVQMSAVEYT